jgi:hypothetical protein
MESLIQHPSPPYLRHLLPEEIRLATIQPGKWADPIYCTLSYARPNVEFMRDKISYKALSYVWGSANITETISLDQVQHAVTLNLACAIRRLRDPVQPVTAWIDAIVGSLYYRNISEVKLMMWIYVVY